VTRRGIEINHLALFSVGFVSYWIIPIAVGLSKINRDVPFISMWYDIFEDISPGTLVGYLFISLLFFLSFCAGSHVGSRVFARSIVDRISLRFDRRLLNIYFFVALILAGVYAITVKEIFFRGYVVEDIMEDFGKRGTFIATTILLLVLALLNSIKFEQQLKATRERINFKRVCLNRYFIAYFLFALLALSMGGRLYFLSSIVMLFVYKTVYIQRIRGRILLLIMFVFLVCSAVIGLIRQVSAITGLDLVTNIVMEPLITSFSMTTFLADDKFRIFCFPIFLINAYTNILPTSLIPDKFNLLIMPSDYGFVHFAPGGATHSYFSFMINFGVVGSFLAVFAFGMFLGFLKVRGDNVLWRTMYLMISGWLTFSFWRDGFAISIVKLITEFSILIPTLIVISLHLLTVIYAPTPRPRVLTNCPDV
jgi:hypothetical protein